MRLSLCLVAALLSGVALAPPAVAAPPQPADDAGSRARCDRLQDQVAMLEADRADLLIRLRDCDSHVTTPQMPSSETRNRTAIGAGVGVAIGGLVTGLTFLGLNRYCTGGERDEERCSGALPAFALLGAVTFSTPIAVGAGIGRSRDTQGERQSRRDDPLRAPERLSRQLQETTRALERQRLTLKEACSAADAVQLGDTTP